MSHITRALPLLLAGALGACTVGPDFQAPAPAAPDDWASWHSGEAAAATALAGSDLRPDWWRQLNDPVLDELETRAFAANHDVQTAALHFAQARVQSGVAASAGAPQVNASADVTRTRQSEYGASTRLFDAIGSSSGAGRDALAKLLSAPFTLYQGGFDAGWEPDLWGKVRRSMEAADANTGRQAAMLDMARLSVASELAQAYADMRQQQRTIALTRDMIAALDEQTGLVDARASGGVASGIDLDTQRASLKQAQGRLPQLEAAETASRNRIALLLGERPGTLNDLLKPRAETSTLPPPSLALGVPSELARRRPDIRAAEAALHAATAQIGVATADLYPSIRIGGSFKLESYKEANLFDWASRTWAIGPSIDLPIFDGGRRKRVVELRKLEEREAAVNYQKTVLSAWAEIDTAMTAYAAEGRTRDALVMRVHALSDAHDLVRARYQGGAVNYIEVLAARTAWLQARADLVESDKRLTHQFIAVNKALGNGPSLARQGD